MTKSDLVLIIPIAAKDEQIRALFGNVEGKNKLKNRQNQLFERISDQCVVHNARFIHMCGR